MQKCDHFVGRKLLDFVSQDSACSILDDFVGQLFLYQSKKICLCCHGDCLQWKMNTNFSYLLSLLFILIHLMQKKLTQVSLCDLHSAEVLADIAWSSR